MHCDFADPRLAAVLLGVVCGGLVASAGVSPGGPEDLWVLLGLSAFWYGPQRRRSWWQRAWRWAFSPPERPARSRDRSSRDVDLERVLPPTALPAQETLEEKADLLAATVHDLKTPLLGIRELAGLVLEHETLSANGRRKLELIHTSSDEAMGRVDGLLSSVAEEAGPALQWEAVDVGALAAEIVDQLQPYAEYKDQCLDCELPSGTCRVEGDSLRLREAASNLVSNALKYSPPAETVTVRVDRSGDEVRLTVSDNGPGLSEDDQTRLFRPFQRLTPQPTGGESSSGVGLYVTKQIATLHDGDIEVQTVEGEGSTFSLVLPAASETA